MLYYLSKMMLLQSLALLLTIVFKPVTSGMNEQYTWHHEHQMDPEGLYNLQWSSDKTTITFNITVKTLGWIGLGFSAYGGMVDADIALGWVSNGIPTITDRFSRDHTQPQLDKQQDLTLLYGAETDEYTTLVFKRERDTGDCKEDIILDDKSPVILIWAWSPNDPDEATGPQYHEGHRGVADVSLSETSTDPVEKRKEKISKDPNEQFQDIKCNKVKPPRTPETHYWHVFVPLVKLKTKHHIIRVSPIIQPGHEQFVHHILGYNCYGQMPPELATFSGVTDYLLFAKTKCSTVLFFWNHGAGSYEIPEDIGISLGGKGDPQYIKLLIHYDNPNLPRDFEDSSGIRLWYTPNLRQHEASLWSIGIEPNTWLVIPPHEEEFIARGWCLSQCTQKYASSFPKDGINIFAVYLHTHSHGRAFKITQFRNGKLLNVLSQDDNFNPANQGQRLLPKRVKALPGDVFLTECIYNTKELQNVTYGGSSTTDEMCMVMISSYPKTDITTCLSAIKTNPMLKELGYENVSEFPLQPNMSETHRAFDSLNWADQSLREKYYKLLNTSDVYVRCESEAFMTLFPEEEGSIPDLADYPLDQHYHRKPETKCKKP